MPFLAYRNWLLQHFYALGGFWGDSGVIAYIMWHQGFLLRMPAVAGGASFLGVHWVPDFWLLTALSWALPLGKIAFFAAFSGFCGALPAAAVLWALRGRANPALAAVLALAFAFNGVILAAARNPHFELLVPGFGILFLAALARRRLALAILFFVLCLGAREDAGLDLFLLLGAAWALGGGRDRPLFWFAVAALAYSVAALAAQHAFFPGRGSLVSVYIGRPAFAQMTPTALAQRLAFFLAFRGYIWLPWLVALAWSLRRRERMLLAGVAAVVPWILLQLLAVSPIAATVSNYYDFPCVFTLFWPLVAPRMQAGLRCFALMLMASFWGVWWQQNPGHLAVPVSFLSAPSVAEQRGTEAALAAFVRGRTAFGRLLVDGSVVALAPDDYAQADILASPAQRPETVIFFGQGYQAWLAAAVIHAAGLDHIYEIPGTELRVASRRRLDGEFGLIRETPQTPCKNL